jgi:hypothetical protein
LGYFKLPPLAATPETRRVYVVHYAGDAVHVPAQSSKILVHAATQPPEALQVAAAPAQVAPAQVAPAQVAPAQVAPAQVAPAQVAPAQVAPAQVAPAQAQFAPHIARDEASTMEKKSHTIDITQVKSLDVTANPSALGLTALGVTTVLLNLSNAGYFGLNSMILAMGIFYGGLGQIVAGIMEWRKGNTFGTTAFLSFGLFWLTLVTLLILPKLGLADAANASALVAYFAMWGLFTFIMFVGSLKANHALQLVLGLLTILFFLLAWAQHTGNVIVTGSTTITQVAGYEGILTGLAAIYAGLVQVLKEMWKRTVVPI